MLIFFIVKLLALCLACELCSCLSICIRYGYELYESVILFLLYILLKRKLTCSSGYDIRPIYGIGYAYQVDIK